VAALLCRPRVLRPSPFATFAFDYHRAGLNVFPLNGKKPLVRNFNQWGGLPRRAIESWSNRWPEANIGLGTRGAGLVVLDADDIDLIPKFLSIAGDTPLRTQTPRGGQHFYFLDLEGKFWGVNRPGGELYDIKGAGWGDQVVLPGSRSESGLGGYTLVGDPDCHVPSAFAQLLDDVPPLREEAYRDLTRTAYGRTQVTVEVPTASLVSMALPNSKIHEGARNCTLFAWACREAHEVARRYGRELGLAELIARCLGLNKAACEPPLSRIEVEKVANSAWSYTMTGVNRPRGRRRLPARVAMVDLQGHSRAVVLLAKLSALGSKVQFSVSAAVREGLIKNWSRHDYQAALDRLLSGRRLAILEDPRKGRGSRGLYRVAEPFDSSELCLLIGALEGDADAAILFQTVLEVWGEGVATLSVRSMVETFNGPYSSWTEPRLRKARARLEDRGLLNRLQVVWTSQRRQGPARFKVRCPSVLAEAKNAGDRTRIETPPPEGEAILARVS
jgi:hypothetical protein